MPTFLGALPSRFRRPRLLIVGCGDVGQRVAAQLPRSVRLLALTSSPERLASLRAQGITPLQGNLDRPATLRRLSGLATQVLHLAPPPTENLIDWRRDPRTLALLRALRLRSLPQSVVYGSTSGVYGDCGGEWVNEARAVNPGTPRGQRRVDAEQQLRFFGRATGTRVHALRIPGIYAPDREGGTPRQRLLKGTAALPPCGAASRNATPMSATTPNSTWVTTLTWPPICMACPSRRACHAAWPSSNCR